MPSTVNTSNLLQSHSTCKAPGSFGHHLITLFVTHSRADALERPVNDQGRKQLQKYIIVSLSRSYARWRDQIWRATLSAPKHSRPAAWATRSVPLEEASGTASRITVITALCSWTATRISHRFLCVFSWPSSTSRWVRCNVHVRCAVCMYTVKIWPSSYFSVPGGYMHTYMACFRVFALGGNVCLIFICVTCGMTKLWPASVLCGWVNNGTCTGVLVFLYYSDILDMLSKLWLLGRVKTSLLVWWEKVACKYNKIYLWMWHINMKYIKKCKIYEIYTIYKKIHIYNIYKIYLKKYKFIRNTKEYKRI